VPGFNNSRDRKGSKILRKGHVTTRVVHIEYSVGCVLVCYKIVGSVTLGGDYDGGGASPVGQQVTRFVAVGVRPAVAASV